MLKTTWMCPIICIITVPAWAGEPTNNHAPSALPWGLNTTFDPDSAAPSTWQQSTDKPPLDYHYYSGQSAHKRLLFEEPKLERQGISRVAPLQTAQSGAFFFSRSLLLPFHYVLGRHRQYEAP